MKVLKNILLCGLLAASCVLIVQLTQAVSESRQLMITTDETLRDVRAKIDDSYATANKTNKAVEIATYETVRILKRFEIEVLGKDKDQPALIYSFKRVADATEQLLRDTDKQVVDLGSESLKLTEAANKAMDTSTAAIVIASNEVQGVGEGIRQNLGTTNKTLQALDKPLTESAINLAKTTENVESTTRSVDEALKPLRKTKNKLWEVLKIGLNFFHIVLPL